MNDALLRIDALRTVYHTGRGDVRAVDGVSLELFAGETFGILGESGCGKTSLASSIMRILPDNGKIESGKIVFRGTDITALGEEEMRTVRWEKIAIIFQSAMNALNPVYRVGEQIAETIEAHEPFAGRAEAAAKAARLLTFSGLGPECADKYPHQMSGGMRQRAIIAMSLACDPEILIADEPTTAIDVIMQDLVLERLKQIQSERKTGMIYISHDVSVLAEICDRIAVMYAGKIVEEGAVAEIYGSPAHPYTSALLGAFPSIKGDKSRLRVIGGEPPSLISPPEGCRFHPRCPRALPECAHEEPVLNILSGRHSASCFNPEIQE